MHVPINVKSPKNISEWQMGFNSAFKGLIIAACPQLQIVYKIRFNIIIVHTTCRPPQVL